MSVGERRAMLRKLKKLEELDRLLKARFIGLSFYNRSVVKIGRA